MDMNFRTKAFGGYDKADVLTFINSLMKEYNSRLSVYVDRIENLKSENDQLKKQLSSEQAKATIAHLEAERELLNERTRELSDALDQTREKLSILADRIIELERDRLISEEPEEKIIPEKAEVSVADANAESPEPTNKAEPIKSESVKAEPKEEVASAKPKKAEPKAEPKKAAAEAVRTARSKDAIIAALEQVEL